MTVNNGWIGRVIDGRFPLLGWLGGSGGSGVFLTELRGPSPRKAAIRLIPASGAEADARLARWQAASRLSHPHLMKLLHTGRSRVDSTEVVYAVTEYADEVLSGVLKDRPLSPDEVGAMLAPVLDALMYLHGQHYIHGRLKPSNVLVVEEQLRLSADTLEVIGEPRRLNHDLDAWDAPEADTAHAASSMDIWSLGMTVSTALSQHPATWNRSSGEPPQLPSTFPRAYAQMVRECLRLDPVQRPTLAELTPSGLERKPIEAKPESQPKLTLVAAAVNSQRPQSQSRKHSRATWIAIVVVIVAIIILVTAYWHPHSKQATTAVQAMPSTAETPERQVSHAVRSKPAPGIAAHPAAPVRRTPAATTAAESPPVNTATARQRRVMPRPPQSALNTIHGTVRVRIRMSVDANGNVANASFISAGPSRYFARMAMAAARKWRFAPGSSSPQIVEFDFRRSGVSAKVE